MRTLTSLLAIAALTLGACQKSGGVNAVSDDDMSMGSPAAKVTVIEYASVACSHCAAFNNDVFPAFKAKYVDTGKVRYVAREALTGDTSIAVAGFLIARCAGKDKYFKVVEAIYRNQMAIMGPGGEPKAGFLAIARSAGMTDAQFEACVTNQKAMDEVQARWTKYATEDKVTSTPTFFVNGKMLPPGETTLVKLDAAIAEAGAGAKAAS